MPDLLPRSPSWVRSAFDHSYAPMAALTQQVSELPAALWDHMLHWPGGFVYVTVDPSRYFPGPMTVRGHETVNVARISVEDLAHGNERVLFTIGHLIDHTLGCGGAADGAWLSEGGGTNPKWKEAGGRLPDLFELGYGVDEVARSDVRAYFSQSLALYCRDRQRLNTADPQITKWFRSTLWNDAFWHTN